MAFLSETDQLLLAVRRRVGDRERSKIEDHEIVDAANEIAQRIFNDILLPADNGYGEYDATISFVADQETYTLPYGLIRFLWGGELDSSGNHTGTHRNIFRSERDLIAGLWLTERSIGVSAIPTTAETDVLKMFYVRSPVPIHIGEASAAAATTITLAANPTLGMTLTEDNAYLGARVRCLEGTTGSGEETTITAYEGSTRVATVSTWGTTPTGTIRYEIEPDLPKEANPYWYLQTTADLVQFRDDVMSDNAIVRLLMQTERERKSLTHVANTRFKRGRAPEWADDLAIH